MGDAHQEESTQRTVVRYEEHHAGGCVCRNAEAAVFGGF